MFAALSAASLPPVRKKGDDRDGTNWEEIDVKLNKSNQLVVNNANQDSLATWFSGGSQLVTKRPRVVKWYNQSNPGTDIIAVGTNVWASIVSNVANSGIDDQPAMTAKILYPIFEGDTIGVYFH